MYNINLSKTIHSGSEKTSRSINLNFLNVHTSLYGDGGYVSHQR